MLIVKIFSNKIFNFCFIYYYIFLMFSCFSQGINVIYFASGKCFLYLLNFNNLITPGVTLLLPFLLKEYSTILMSGCFLKKSIKKRHLCQDDKNYYYFCKSNTPIINLIVGSRNMIKISKNMSF